MLTGERVRLEPLAVAHLAALRGNAGDDAIWQFTFHTNPFLSDDSALAWYHEMRRTEDALTFAVVDLASGLAIGATRLFDIDPANRKLEIGYTFLAKRYWRTGINRECKRLLLECVFERCGAVRVQFKAEAINWRSHQALLALGATHEGTLRRFRIRPSDGDVRDVAIYSIVDSDWPALKTRLNAQEKHSAPS